MDTISIAIAGFSVVSALLLLLIYAFFVDVPGKSAHSIVWCASLLVWLGSFVHGLRAQRRQFRFEFFYFIVMAALAVLVLILGFALPFMDDALFYHFYSSAIGVGLAIMIVALIANPTLIGDLSEAARARYGTSTLGGMDVDGC